jgi:hypothetical protein
MHRVVVPAAVLAVLVALAVVQAGRARVVLARVVRVRVVRVLMVPRVPRVHLVLPVPAGAAATLATATALVVVEPPAGSAVPPVPGGADMTPRSGLQTDTGARDMRAPNAVVQHLAYPGLQGAVVLEDAAPVLSALTTLMTGWTPEVVTMRPEHGGHDPASLVSRVVAWNDRFDLYSPWLEEPLQGLMAASAACGVVADMSQAFCNQHHGCLGLHCGAVQINGHLVVLTGPARAGKSTLISRLTAEPDMTVFCDDILPVLEDGLAFGLGLAPRLRLPLPDNVTDAFRLHVDDYMGPADRRYGYLCGPNIAPHGTRAPVAAFIVLARGQDVPARLHRMEPSEAVQHLVRQNITAPNAGTAHFDQVTRLAQSVLCLKMVYSDLEDAVNVLRRAFGTRDLPAASVPIAPPLPMQIEPVQCAAADPAQVYRRSPEVAVRAVQDDLFLWHATEYSYFHLNQVARAIWTLLEDPINGADITAILSDAFPDADPAQIAADVAALLGAFEAALLVQPVF